MPRGRPGTQMVGLPREHIRGPHGGALCGAKRRWGVVLAQVPEESNCKKCQRLREAREAANKQIASLHGDEQLQRLRKKFSGR